MLKSLPFLKDNDGGDHDQGKSDNVVPFDPFSQIEDGKNKKDSQGEDFLNGL